MVETKITEISDDLLNRRIKNSLSKLNRVSNEKEAFNAIKDRVIALRNGLNQDSHYLNRSLITERERLHNASKSIKELCKALKAVDWRDRYDIAEMAAKYSETWNHQDLWSKEDEPQYEGSNFQMRLEALTIAIDLKAKSLKKNNKDLAKLTIIIWFKDLFSQYSSRKPSKQGAFCEFMNIICSIILSGNSNMERSIQTYRDNSALLKDLAPLALKAFLDSKSSK